MTKLYTLFVFLFFTIVLYAQDAQVLIGKVSFISGENVYLKFENTHFINIGDTIYLLNKQGAQQKSLLKITAKSSTTIVATNLGNNAIKIGDQFEYKFIKEKQVTIAKPLELASSQLVLVVDPAKIDTTTAMVKKEPIPIIYNGRFTLSHLGNYATDSNGNGSRQMVTLLLNTQNSFVKGLSTETYLNYASYGLNANGQSGNKDNQFRVYNLALKYNWGKSNELVLGRRFNYRLSSLGAIDGVQFEKGINNFYFGGIAGYRPDLYDFSFNSNLMQYGGYLGFSQSNKQFNSSTSVGIIAQSLLGKTDRRYAALQHNTNIQKFNFFLSSELELFNPINNQYRISSLYSSMSYRFQPGFTFLVSYDSRKTIIYYESYLTEASRYLLEDLNREGLRVRVNFKISKNAFSGISLTNRFQSDGKNASQNYNAFLNLTKLPFINGALYISANSNQSQIVKTQTVMGRYQIAFLKEKLQANFYYRYQNMQYVNWNQVQHINQYAGFNANYHVNNKLSFNTFVEMASLPNGKTSSIGLSCVKRF